jgi:hypothetical protein
MVLNLIHGKGTVNAYGTCLYSQTAQRPEHYRRLIPEKPWNNTLQWPRLPAIAREYRPAQRPENTTGAHKIKTKGGPLTITATVAFSGPTLC